MIKIITIAIALLTLYGCGSISPHHACGVTELNKQYRAKCKY